MRNAERFWELHSHKSLKPPKTLELLNTYLQVFSELELIPVPLKESRTGKLIPMFQWGEVKSVDDAKKLLSQMSIDDARKIRGFAVITGSPSKAIVLDVDDEEKFSKWASEVLGVGLENLKELADWTVRSKSGGWHFWFRTDGAKRFKTVQRQDLGFDLRGENGLCNLVAWDRGDGQLYEFLCFGNAKEEEKTTFLKDLYGVLYTSKEEVPKVEGQVQSELGKALREAYERGELDGWTIEAGLSTLLVKWGYSDEQIHKLFQEVYGESYDYHRTQYIIQRTRGKDLGINAEFLNYLRAKGLLKKRMDKDDWEEWRVTENRIFRYSSTGRVIARVDRIDVLARIDVGDRPLLRVRFRGKEYLIPADGSRTELMRALGTPLSSKEYETYMAYINYVLGSGQVPTWKFYTSLGWDEEDWTFKHPLIVGSEKFMSKNPQIELLLKKSKEAMKSPDWMEKNEEFMAFLKEQIRSATGFSVLYTLGLASLFISTISGCMPFTVIVSGISGAGKTTACQMVQNSFLPLEISLTVNTTQNSLELTLSRLSNMPVLFDELKLSKVDTEDIVFMTASGKGKARATADLSVKVRDLRSVVFLTTEITPEFERQGAIRRVLILHVDSRQDLFGTHANNLPYSIRTAWGHGIVFARALMEDRELIYTLWDKAEAWLKEKNFQFFEFQHIALPCIASTFLMEHVLEVDMEAVRRRIYALIEEQYTAFEEREKDVVELWAEWLLQHRAYFYRTVVRYNLRGDSYTQEIEPKVRAWGEINGNVAYLFSFAFEEFARYCKKNQRKLAKELIERGILEPSKDKRSSQVRYVRGASARVYVLRIPHNLENYSGRNGDADGVEMERVEDQDKQAVMEEFLTSAGLEPEDVTEVVEFAMQFSGISWKRQGSKLKFIADGIEVDVELDIQELQNMDKVEAKEHVLITIERVAEIEPTTTS